MDYSLPESKKFLDILNPVKRRIENIPVENPKTAHRIVSLIPADCPFERDIKLFGRTIAHIPPMCKINPLYEPLVMLRFKALCYLVDECGEDMAALTWSFKTWFFSLNHFSLAHLDALLAHVFGSTSLGEQSRINEYKPLSVYLNIKKALGTFQAQ